MPSATTWPPGGAQQEDGVWVRLRKCGVESPPGCVPAWGPWANYLARVDFSVLCENGKGNTTYLISWIVAAAEVMFVN